MSLSDDPIPAKLLHGACIADVLVPVAVDTAYSYRVPEGLALKEGDVVRIPLGPRETIGVVWRLAANSGAGRSNLKAIIGLCDHPALPPGLQAFLERVAAYTLAPRGLVARMALKGIVEKDKPERIAIGVRFCGIEPARLTPARSRVLDLARDGLLRSKRDLALSTGVSQAVIDGLVDEGCLIAEPLARLIEPLPGPDHAVTDLSDTQRQAADALIAAVRAGGFSTSLIEGVTGSGKTEVYFEALAQALRQGRQALILMPEIALTGEFLTRFEKRFGVKPAEWHSGVTGRRRERIFKGLAEGSLPVVAGARSALFLPYRRLGLIIVDEEHEQAYKQEDGITYQARDMAVLRGHVEQFPVVLASATPSIESRVNAQRGRYRHLVLPDRYAGRALPDVGTIDLRREGPARGSWLAPRLIDALEQTLARGEQGLLFLNRRGYAPLTLCRSCGHRFQCPNCSAWLVEHRFSRSLQCHHCGHRERRPNECPECGTLDSLVGCGPGVERLAEEAATRFAQARILTLSSDMPGGIERMRRELAEIAEGKVDLVIGTQLVAKGHNFPQLTCVGVVDADLGLTSGDPRAAERSFQILQQVTGRAGRGEKPGHALIQTHQPDHPVIAAMCAGDSEAFYAAEIEQRRFAGLPPFGRLAALIVSGTDRDETLKQARAIAMAGHEMMRHAGRRDDETIHLLGPAEAPLALIRGRHRQRLLVKASRTADLQAYLRSLLAAAPKPRGSVRVQVDVDPMSFL